MFSQKKFHYGYHCPKYTFVVLSLLILNMYLLICCLSIRLTETAQKVCVFGVNLVRDFPYSVRMRENAGKNNSKYGYFSRIVSIDIKQKKEKIFHYKIHCKKKSFLLGISSVNLFLRIRSDLPKKSFRKNFIFCAVISVVDAEAYLTHYWKHQQIVWKQSV